MDEGYGNPFSEDSMAISVDSLILGTERSNSSNEAYAMFMVNMVIGS